MAKRDRAGYFSLLASINERIQRAQVRAAIAVNQLGQEGDPTASQRSVSTVSWRTSRPRRSGSGMPLPSLEQEAGLIERIRKFCWNLARPLPFWEASYPLEVAVEQ